MLGDDLDGATLGWSTRTRSTLEVVTGRCSLSRNIRRIPRPIRPNSNTPSLSTEPCSCASTGSGQYSGWPEMRIAFPPRHSMWYWRFLVSTSIKEPRTRLLQSTSSADVILGFSTVSDAIRRHWLRPFCKWDRNSYGMDENAWIV